MPAAPPKTAVLLAREPAELDPYVEEWDRLAVGASRPLQRPSWLLAWWLAKRESNSLSELRVAVALDAGSVVGVLPFHVRNPEATIPFFELLGGGAFWGQGPVLAANAPPDTLELLTEALAQSCPEPAVVALDAVDPSLDWAQRAAARWPGDGAWLHARTRSRPSLTVTLDGNFHDWLHGTGRRSEHRRRLRRLAERGVTLRRSTSELEFQRDLASLAQLHHVRWNHNSQWLTPAVEGALRLAGSQLFDSGGVHLWVLEGEAGMVGATLFASAGSESCSLMTAFDSAWRAYGPGIATLLAGIEDAFARGEGSVELGHGLFEYQVQLADSSRPLAWLRMFPRGRRYALARAAWTPRHIREKAQQLRVRLRPRQRIESARTRLRSGGRSGYRSGGTSTQSARVRGWDGD